MRGRRVVLLGLLALLWTMSAAAQSTPSRPHTTATLVAATDAIEPGRPLTVGIRLKMEPGWHTYWRNPGESGLPTRVKWTLPPGFEAAEIRWPTPSRFTSGPLVNYGYEHEVLLPVEIKVPAAVSEKQVRLAARVDWLECQEACIPGKAELTLELPVRNNTRPSSDAAAFEAARQRLPRAAPGWRFTARATTAEVLLSIAPPRGATVAEAYFFPVTTRLLDDSKPQKLERTAGGYRLSLARDPNGQPSERLAGVLSTGAARAKAIELDVPLMR